VLVRVVGMQEYRTICGDGRSREVDERGREASFNALSCCCFGRGSQFLADKRLEEVGFESCTGKIGRYGSLRYLVPFTCNSGRYYQQTLRPVEAPS